MRSIFTLIAPLVVAHCNGVVGQGYISFFATLFSHPGEICIIEVKIIGAALTLKLGHTFFLSLIYQEAAMPIHDMHVIES